MRNVLFFYLFLPLFAGLSFSVHAAPDPSQAKQPAITVLEPVSSSSQMKINLNNADVLTLQKELNGVGKAKAEAIVAYREAHGVFDSVDELLEVKGIGKELLDRNRNKLKVE